MTAHDPLKSALEELAGLQDTYKAVDQSARAADRKMAEAEVELSGLLRARALIADLVQSAQRRVLQLRALADAVEGRGEAVGVKGEIGRQCPGAVGHPGPVGET